MKITILLYLSLASVFYLGCEKSFDSVVDQKPSNYQVSGVRTIDSIRYVPGDSLVHITISFINSDDIKNVFIDIISSDDQKLNSSSFSLLDNGKSENGDLVAGDNTYSNKFPLSQFYPIGIYTIKYFVEDINSISKQVAIQNFKYDNGQTNIAPVISNAIIEPDTLVIIDTTIIQILVEADDQNGLNDIERVYFVVYRPDGSSNNIKLDLFDDGKVQEHGDQIANDGIYALKIQVDQSNMKGTYRFEFQAVDRGKKISNVINQFVLIQ